MEMSNRYPLYSVEILLNVEINLIANRFKDFVMGIRYSEDLKVVDRSTFLKYIETLGNYNKTEIVTPDSECKVILYIKSFHDRSAMAVAIHNQCENIFKIDPTVINVFK